MKRLIVRLVGWLGLLAVLASGVSKAEEHVPAPALRLASPTLEVSFPVHSSLIQFFYVPQGDGQEPNIEVYLSYRSAGEVQTAHLETIQPEGRAAEIATVFTLNADGDRDRELFVVAKWPIRHGALGTEGTYYQVYVYRKLSADEGQIKFGRARDVEERFGSGFDGTREGVTVSFPYKDYQSIRANITP